MKLKIFRPKPFRSNKRALSPAISTVIMTSAIIVLILSAMMYSQNYLNASIAENEFAVNKQFMLTTALQVDDIAWIIGRAQTIRYSSRYGVVNFQENVLSYKFEVETNGIWHDVFTNETGAIMFDTITTDSLLGNYHFENISSTSRSFNQTGSSAPVANVYAIEKGTASGQNEARIVIVPTVRMMKSTIGSQNYVKFYLPLLQKGTIAQSIQSVTLIGQPMSKYVFDNVDAVRFTVTFPATSRGYNSDFFKFERDSVTIPLDSDSVVDFYLGEVSVSLGLYA
jgi:hypothetical protein